MNRISSPREMSMAVDFAGRNSRRLLAIVMVSATALSTFLIHADPAPPMVGLDRVLALGALHPLVVRASLSAEADGAQATASRRQSVWPTIGVSGFIGRTDALSSLETPIGAFSIGDKERGQIQETIRLPILGESSRLHADADALKASSSALNAKRFADSRALVAANFYLDLLSLQATAQSIKSLHESFMARLDRSKALLKSGQVLAADVLEIQYELQRTSQDIVRIDGQIAVTQRELSDAIGSDVVVQAAPLKWVPQLVSDIGNLSEDAIVTQLQNRGDILALRDGIASLSKSAESIAAEQRRPVMDLVVQHDDRRGMDVLPPHENMISVQFSIPLFNAGSVEPRHLAALLERDALAAALTDRERSARTDLERVKVSFYTAQSMKGLAAVAIESASQTLDMRRSLYDIGRLNVDELLTAESDLERQKALATTTEIDIMRSWLEYQYALGRNMAGLQIPVSQ